VGLAASASRRVRASHRLPDLAGLVDGAGWVSGGLDLTAGAAADAGAGSGLVGAAGGGAVAGAFGLFCAAVWAALGWAGVVDVGGWLTVGPVLMEAAPAGVFAVPGLVEA
jgi:hypothetical protein